MLKDLPPKIEQILFCNQTTQQRQFYTQLVKQSRTRILPLDSSTPPSLPLHAPPSPLAAAKTTKKTKKTKMNKTDAEESQQRITNVMMELRKMAAHPLLHRNLYPDETLMEMSKEIMKEDDYWDANQQFIFEDMQVLSDFELHSLCLKHHHIRHRRLPDSAIFDCGKIQELMTKLLPESQSRKDRVLIFSQFTMMLDILASVLTLSNFSFVRLDGSTPVSERQIIIDQFHKDDSIFCFLLSTKAGGCRCLGCGAGSFADVCGVGGFGINLTAANVVIIYDLDFNPQNDAQAEDRAHRVGQTRYLRVFGLSLIALVTCPSSNSSPKAPWRSKSTTWQGKNSTSTNPLAAYPTLKVFHDLEMTNLRRCHPRFHAAWCAAC